MCEVAVMTMREKLQMHKQIETINQQKLKEWKEKKHNVDSEKAD